MTIASASFDLTIVGGGIIGLATARHILLRHPKLKVCVLEKDGHLAQHQSKRNSGVIHAGIYYKPRSLRSRLCIKGSQLAFEYCKQKSIPVKKCGKLVLAGHRRPDQVENLHKLYLNAKESGIEDVQLVDKNQINFIQPGAKAAIQGLWSPKTAVVDWNQVANAYASDFSNNGGHIFTKFSADFFLPQVNGSIQISNIHLTKSVVTKSLIVCAGIFSSLLAKRLGADYYPSIIPFRGNYFLLRSELASQIKTNLYPVPNPKLPFLGVHITPRVDGSVLVGPNAMLSLEYEPYMPMAKFSLFDFMHIITNPSLLNLVRRKDIRAAGLQEYKKSRSKQLVVEELIPLLEHITEDDLIPTDFYGIRAQAVSRRGHLIDELLIEKSKNPDLSNVLIVKNCTSPAATSSLALAEKIADAADVQFS